MKLISNGVVITIQARSCDDDVLRKLKRTIEIEQRVIAIQKDLIRELEERQRFQMVE